MTSVVVKTIREKKEFPFCMPALAFFFFKPVMFKYLNSSEKFRLRGLLFKTFAGHYQACCRSSAPGLYTTDTVPNHSLCFCGFEWQSVLSKTKLKAKTKRVPVKSYQNTHNLRLFSQLDSRFVGRTSTT